jgi:hypothetical protein
MGCPRSRTRKGCGQVPTSPQHMFWGKVARNFPPATRSTVQLPLAAGEKMAWHLQIISACHDHHDLWVQVTVRDMRFLMSFDGPNRLVPIRWPVRALQSTGERGFSIAALALFRTNRRLDNVVVARFPIASIGLTNSSISMRLVELPRMPWIKTGDSFLDRSVSSLPEPVFTQLINAVRHSPAEWRSNRPFCPGKSHQSGAGPPPSAHRRLHLPLWASFRRREFPGSNPAVFLGALWALRTRCTARRPPQMQRLMPLSAQLVTIATCRHLCPSRPSLQTTPRMISENRRQRRPGSSRASGMRQVPARQISAHRPSLLASVSDHM